jgi:hypothetical protein
MTTLLFKIRFTESQNQFIKNYLIQKIEVFTPSFTGEEIDSSLLSLLENLEKYNDKEFLLFESYMDILESMVNELFIENKVFFPNKQLSPLVFEIQELLKKSKDNWVYGSYSTFGDDGEDE